MLSQTLCATLCVSCHFSRPLISKTYQRPRKRSRHCARATECLLSGAKRKCDCTSKMSAYGPKRTWLQFTGIKRLVGSSHSIRPKHEAYTESQKNHDDRRIYHHHGIKLHTDISSSWHQTA